MLGLCGRRDPGGFVVERVVDLPTKPAALSTCTPEAFAASPIGALS